jgi:hypothetical protein
MESRPGTIATSLATPIPISVSPFATASATSVPDGNNLVFTFLSKRVILALTVELYRRGHT